MRLRFPRAYAQTVAKLRVPFGFLLVAAFAVGSHPSQLSLLVGVPVAIAGLALRAWAAGHLRKDSELARSGPYRYLRNPLYAGTSLVAAGLVIAGRNATLALLFAGVFGLIYLPAIELEEQHLRDLFPNFGEFAREVPALLPRWPAASSPAAAFRFAQYKRNREYQALWGFLAGIALLFWKLWLR